MDEFIKSVKAFLYDRTVSPLFGASLMAWAMWNYKVFIVVLDGDEKLETKLEFLDKYFGPLIHIVGNTLYISGWFYNGILWPGLLTALYLFAYPKVAKPVYEISLQNQIDLRKVKQEKEKQRLLSIEESIKLTAEIEQMRLKSEKDAENARTTISRLTERINSLEAELNGYKATEPTKKIDVPNDDLDEDGFRKLIGNTVDLQNGAFTLEKLFEPSVWKELSSQTKNQYGKLFRRMVDRGDFAGIEWVGRGSNNLAMYKKISPRITTKQIAKSGAEEKIKEYLNTIQLSSNSISPNEREALIQKIASYCAHNDIGVDMLKILLMVVANEGEAGLKLVTESLSHLLSRIEIDHQLNKLVEEDLLIKFNGSLHLTDEGKSAAVESGMTAFIKGMGKRSK